MNNKLSQNNNQMVSEEEIKAEINVEEIKIIVENTNH
jgi:hypothetical protein